MSNNKDFFKERWEAEQPAFRKVLHALPADRLDYAPHERCTKACDLAWQLAEEQRHLSHLLEHGEIEFVPSPAPPHDQVLSAWDKATEDLRGKIDSVDEDKWENSRAKFLMGGKVVWEDSLKNMFWGYLFDMVHHRGQLSSYLRPMGGKVPAIYGPSGDDMGG